MLALLELLVAVPQLFYLIPSPSVMFTDLVSQPQSIPLTKNIIEPLRGNGDLFFFFFFFDYMLYDPIDIKDKNRQN